MIRRRARTASSSVGRVAAHALAAPAVAALSVLAFSGTFDGATGVASAQAPPQAVGIGDDVVNGVRPSLGIVAVGEDDRSVGWVAAKGVVVTSDVVAKEVGTSVTFTPLDSKAEVTCYVGDHDDGTRLSVLRCGQLDAPPLKIESRYPSPGTPVFVATLAAGTVGVEGGLIIANDVRFMGEKRLRLSFVADGESGRAPSDGVLTYDDLPGSPVIDGSGSVVSTTFVSPVEGGQPLGVTPAELTRSVEKVLPLPASFASAAVITGGKRAIIPAAIGLVAGIIWGLLARNHTVVLKAIGLSAVGVIAVAGYSILTMLVVGPQALI